MGIGDTLARAFSPFYDSLLTRQFRTGKPRNDQVLSAGNILFPALRHRSIGQAPALNG